MSNLIDSKRVEDLPLVNRDLTQLAFIQPGVVKIPSSGNAGVFSGMGDKFTVAGARGTQNLYLLDGVSNADLSGNAQGSSGSYMGSETVQEIQIVTNNYSAEYRSAAGGIVSAITKSGTNTISGVGLRVLPERRAQRAELFRQEVQPAEAAARSQPVSAARSAVPSCATRCSSSPATKGLREDRSRPDTATVPSANARAGTARQRRPSSDRPGYRPATWISSQYPASGQHHRSGLRRYGADCRHLRSVPIRNNFALGKVDYNINNDNVLSGTYNFDQGHRSPYGILGDVAARSAAKCLGRDVRCRTKWTSVLVEVCSQRGQLRLQRQPAVRRPAVEPRSITAISSSGRTGSASGNSMSPASDRGRISRGRILLSTASLLAEGRLLRLNTRQPLDPRGS